MTDAFEAAWGEASATDWLEALSTVSEKAEIKAMDAPAMLWATKDALDGVAVEDEEVDATKDALDWAAVEDTYEVAAALDGQQAAAAVAMEETEQGLENAAKETLLMDVVVALAAS